MKRMKSMIVKVCVGIILFIIFVYIAICAYLYFSAEATREEHRDIREYALLEDGTNVLEIWDYKNGGIWPEKIEDNMDVLDYLLVYYCPWDSNYLGYLTVSYEQADYEAEVKRLKEYPSTDYIGNYGVTGFSTYDVLAIKAGDQGFVYALTDNKNIVIYVTMIFPEYSMDIAYEEYMPTDYLPEGLDIGEDNLTKQAMIGN